MKTRILASIPIALILIAALWLQSWVLVALMLVISLIAQKEMLGAVASDGRKPVKSLAYIFVAVTPAILYAFGLSMLFVSYVVIIFGLFVICMFSKEYNFKSFTGTLLSTVYPQFFFVFIYLIAFNFTNMRIAGSNPVMLLMCVLPPIFSDVLAYFTGRALGKRKLCPEISPNKTVAGAVGGIIGGVIAGALVWLFFGSGIVFANFIWDLSAAAFIVLGAVTAFISQLGDLSASFIKRHYEIKDYGTLIPGHGGILDRVDSMLFAMPTVYIFMFVYYSVIYAA